MTITKAGLIASASLLDWLKYKGQPLEVLNMEKFGISTREGEQRNKENKTTFFNRKSQLTTEENDKKPE